MVIAVKLVLVDSHALIHRAYHAIDARLTSSSGEPTNATFGFASTLLKVLSDEKPELVAACFDVGPSFRHEEFAEYKAHRPEMAEDLRPQIKRSREVAEALGIPVFGLERYEADDLLGTLARQASEQNIDVVIVTGDSDTFQLITPRVHVLTFARQINETVVYDETKVKERYGLTPRQLIDFKALKGDPSDNIPGVKGIGEKTATSLVQKHGSVESIYEHLDDVEPRWREKLASGRDDAFMSKHLVTIVTDAPIQLDVNACRVGEYDYERAVTLFRELGFRTLIDRLPTTSQATQVVSAQAVPMTTNYHTVDTDAALDALVAKLKSLDAFSFDTETTGTDAMRAELVGISIGVGNGEAYYIPVARSQNSEARSELGQLTFDMTDDATRNTQYTALPREIVVKKLKPIFENARIVKYGHNAKYDMTVLAENAGVNVRGVTFDSMIAAHLVEQGNASIGLKQLAEDKFSAKMTNIEELIGKGKNQITMAQVPVAQVAPYACADADFTFRLVEHYQPQLAEYDVEKLFRDVEMPLVPVLMKMERTGVLLDLDALKQMSIELTKRLRELEIDIQSQVGAPINIASPVQLADALFKKLGLPSDRLPKTKTGQISTAADVLESIRDSHPVIALILEHRELSKLQGTYVDALPVLVHPRTGRLHTDYNQTGTTTGRVSSSNPNLQNIPIRTELGRKVRRAFIAPRGSKLVSADYSQVELRILAHVTHDPGLLDAFAHGEDIHAATAARLFGVELAQVTSDMRRLGKTINFGIAYGITDFGISAQTKLSISESRQLIDNYFAKFAGVKEYIDSTKREAHERGYVQTLLGRRRYFPELKGKSSGSPAARAAEREAINMPIQGSAADIIKLAMIRLHDELSKGKLNAKMILQVHDELVFECPESELDAVVALVRDVMENAYPLESKLKVDVGVGQSWDET
jgi:DNA polymerase-1